jgi:hypothetical protein
MLPQRERTGNAVSTSLGLTEPYRGGGAYLPHPTAHSAPTS